MAKDFNNNYIEVSLSEKNNKFIDICITEERDYGKEDNKDMDVARDKLIKKILKAIKREVKYFNGIHKREWNLYMFGKSSLKMFKLVDK